MPRLILRSLSCSFRISSRLVSIVLLLCHVDPLLTRLLALRRCWRIPFLSLLVAGPPVLLRYLRLILVVIILFLVFFSSHDVASGRSYALFGENSFLNWRYISWLLLVNIILLLLLLVLLVSILIWRGLFRLGHVRLRLLVLRLRLLGRRDLLGRFIYRRC